MPHEVYERLKFSFREMHRLTQQRVKPVQDRLQGTHGTVEIRWEQVGAKRSGPARSIQVIPDGVIQTDEGTVMHERWLKSHVP